MNATKKIRVLIVDDSAFMRIAIERMLKEESRIEVIGSASNGQEGVEKVMRLLPDVVTMDIEMPVMDGLHALKEIMQHQPKPVIMVSSLTQNGAKATLDALDLGAIDYVSKPGTTLSYNIFDLKRELQTKIIAASESSPATLRPKLPAYVPKRAGQSSDANVLIDRLVVIGASTGGPPAVQSLLSSLSGIVPAPIIIAQHMPQMFTKAFAQRLNSLCQVRVKEAVDGEILQRSVAYICPGDFQTRFKKVDQGKYAFVITSNQQERAKFAPCIDHMFLSAAELFGAKAIGVILTGMGDDGVQGLLKLRSLGGLTIAQDKNSSVIYGMPRAAAERGAAARILTLGDIAREIGLSLQ